MPPIEPEEIEEEEDGVTCSYCEEPVPEDETHEVSDYGIVCESCTDSDDFQECEECNELRHRDSLEWTLYDTHVCGGCRNRYYDWCDPCDGYFRSGDSDHDHCGCDCCSPQLSFTIRNDGFAPLANDTRATVELPAGVISDVGITEIRNCLYRTTDDFGLATALVGALGEKWQEKQGNYTKRLSRLAYKEHGTKLSPDVLSTVGNIASAHSQAVAFAIETTRNLNLPAEDFYHDESCWWSSYGESRCALKSNGGFGIRSFDERGYVSGRVWVLPLKRTSTPPPEYGALVPTFDTEHADAFVTFNGYGALSGYAPARMLAHMFGVTYRKIAFEASPMYVNSGGYLVAREEIAEHYTDGGISLELYEHASLWEAERLAEVA